MKALEIKKENVNSEIRKEQSVQEEFSIPNEACCSPEFSEGCIFSE